MKVEWYDFSMSSRKIWVAVAVAVVVVLTAIVIVPKLIIPERTATSFNWDDTSRNLEKGLGVDSSGLRLAYRYELSPNNVDPLYSSSITGCTIVGKVTRVADHNESEEKVSTEALPRKGVVKETSFVYGNDIKVPVKYEVVEEEDKFIVLFSRYFAQENLMTFFTVTCGSASERQIAFDQATDGIRFAAGSSKV